MVWAEKIACETRNFIIMALSPIDEKTSEKRISFLQGTNGPSQMCPLLGGFYCKAMRCEAVYQVLLL